MPDFLCKKEMTMLTRIGPKLYIIHLVAKALGVLIHVEGMPLGSDRNVPRNPFPGSQQQSGAIAVRG